MLKTLGHFAAGAILLFSLPALADHGLFMVVKGTVKVLSAKDKKESLAKVGSKVFSGDTVITDKDARAKIVMSDRNVLQLSPESTLEISKYKTGATEKDREVQVALNNGKVRVEVEQKYGEKNKFELRTPTAVAGVRGTKYVASYNQTTASSTFMVLSGSVVVNSLRGGAPVTLTANMISTVNNNSPPSESRKMSPQERQDAQGEGTAPGASNSSAATESMVSAELKGPEVKPEATNAAPAPNPPPAVTAQPPPPPKPPLPPPAVKEIIQNKNSKSKVIVTPVPQ